MRQSDESDKLDMDFCRKRKGTLKVLSCITLTVVIFMLLSSDSTADIMVKEGPFNLDDPKDYSLDVRISDGGSPLQISITKLAIKVSEIQRFKGISFDFQCMC